MYTHCLTGGCRLLLSFTIICLFLCNLSLPASGQKRALDGQEATCQIKITDKTKGTKTFKVDLNQVGFFDRVVGVEPLDKVAVDITYPKGTEGENIVISVLDGGQIIDDDKKAKPVKQIKLDNQKKFSFTFQVSSHPGTHRVLLRKGFDQKVVELWVGEEPESAKN